MSSVLSIIAALILISLLVTIHELGHFLTGRALGFAINEFAVGMGPVLLQKERNGIKYSLRALPIGGMCQFYGEDEAAADSRCFNAKPVWKRFLVVVAGPVMNLLFAIVFSIVTMMAYGDYVPAVYEIPNADSPAAVSGMQPGDVLVAVDGKKIGSFQDATTKIQNGNSENMVITVKRDGKLVDLNLGNVYNEEAGRNLIGITISAVREKMPFFQAVGGSFRYLWSIIRETFTSLVGLIRGSTEVADVTGPVGIISYISLAVRTGLETVLRLAVLISASLGIMNLLPLPALDGGRLVFLILEAVRGKPIPPEKEGLVHLIGLGLLFALMIFITFHDVSRLLRGGM